MYILPFMLAEKLEQNESLAAKNINDEMQNLFF